MPPPLKLVNSLPHWSYTGGMLEALPLVLLHYKVTTTRIDGNNKRIHLGLAKCWWTFLLFLTQMYEVVKRGKFSATSDSTSFSRVVVFSSSECDVGFDGFWGLALAPMEPCCHDKLRSQFLKLAGSSPAKTEMSSQNVLCMLMLWHCHYYLCSGSNIDYMLFPALTW